MSRDLTYQGTRSHLLSEFAQLSTPNRLSHLRVAVQQPQGHLQVVSNMIDFNLGPQEALDALRFSVDLNTGAVNLEAGLDPGTVSNLERRGHRVDVLDGYARASFGGGQVIARDAETGVLTAGSEPRKDGAAVGW